MPIAGPGGCPSALRSGDLYTHCFNGTMIEDGHVAQSFHEARERGVLFDVGHDGFSSSGQSRCGSVSGPSVVQCLLGGIYNVLRRVEIWFSGAKPDDIQPLCA